MRTNTKIIIRIAQIQYELHVRDFWNTKQAFYLVSCGETYVKCRKLAIWGVPSVQYNATANKNNIWIPHSNDCKNCFFCDVTSYRGPGCLTRYNDLLRVRRSRDWIPVCVWGGGGIFRTLPWLGLWPTQPSAQWVLWLLPGSKEALPTAVVKERAE
jgi:hypothetical protein